MRDFFKGNNMRDFFKGNNEGTRKVCETIKAL